MSEIDSGFDVDHAMTVLPTELQRGRKQASNRAAWEQLFHKINSGKKIKQYKGVNPQAYIFVAAPGSNYGDQGRTFDVERLGRREGRVAMDLYRDDQNGPVIKYAVPIVALAYALNEIRKDPRYTQFFEGLSGDDVINLAETGKLTLNMVLSAAEEVGANVQELVPSRELH